ncbi:MAG: hypothetical protein AAGJ46_17930 [Planctomycetota bacterium]
MIHFSCDCCGQIIDPERETRYVVRVEVYSAVEPGADNFPEPDADNLEQISELLDGDEDGLLGEGEGYQAERYDLCEACRAEFAKNPMARLAMPKIGFSEN